MFFLTLSGFTACVLCVCVLNVKQRAQKLVQIQLCSVPGPAFSQHPYQKQHQLSQAMCWHLAVGFWPNPSLNATSAGGKSFSVLQTAHQGRILLAF